MTDSVYAYVRKDGTVETWRRKEFSDGSRSVFHYEDYGSEEETTLRLAASEYYKVRRSAPELPISRWADTVEEWNREVG